MTYYKPRDSDLQLGFVYIPRNIIVGEFYMAETSENFSANSRNEMLGQRHSVFLQPLPQPHTNRGKIRTYVRAVMPKRPL